MSFRFWGGWSLAATALLFAFFLTDTRSPSAGAPASQPTSQPSEESPAENSIEAAPAGMIAVPSGTFVMGRDTGEPDEAPAHTVTLDPFYIDSTEVTNRQFARFVEETGYVTRAERDGYCFGFLEGGTDFVRIDGGSWRRPEGRDSTIENRMGHPVVCVTWDDAAAYAEWAGKRLPTEAEWEYAARAGADGHFAAITDAHADHPPEVSGTAAAAKSDTAAHRSARSHDSAGSDGSHNHTGDNHENHNHAAHDHADHSAKSIAKIQANVWQGVWPHTNRRADGYFYTSPAGSFPANEWGLHDTIGNVWEWTADWYAADYYRHAPAENPSGPDSGTYRVARGGSWFCSPQYCGAYNTHYRGASPPDQAFNNVGFRCAKDAVEGDTLDATAAEKSARTEVRG